MFIETIYKDYSNLQAFTVTKRYILGTGINNDELFEIPKKVFENLFEKLVNLEEEINSLLN